MFDRDGRTVERIHAMRAELARLSDAELRATASKTDSLPTWIALAATAASRVLGQEMYDVQLRGALALARGSIAEMQTGEGKTLAAVPAISWFAREHRGVHVMTVNDYLARHDAAWMGGIYRLLGLSVAHVQQEMTASERGAAYAADVTYATQNEIGFDFLRDRIAMRQDEQVHRAFHAVVIDEADSILIDEARVPLVIAGGESGDRGLAYVADQIVRDLAGGEHYTIDPGAHNVALTDAGIHAVESALGCGSLFDNRNLAVHEAVQEALHAHALLHRDVDYIVKNGAIEMVDEFKGRIALDRRWPAGLHTAIEAKEGVAAKSQGMILGQITLQHLVALYPTVCGMTATASSQSLEFHRVYGLQVETIPPNRPMVRVDHSDTVFRTKGREGRGGSGRNSQGACHRPPGAGGHGERGGFRTPQFAAAGRGSRGPECPPRRARSSNHRARRRTGRGYGFDQHGGPRHRYQARQGRRGTGRPLCDRGQQAREPAHR
jgi:preprotein translocase subunit SecA